ncbi:MAG: MATE family efflux transporter [Hominenteromicrobium sp.]
MRTYFRFTALSVLGMLGLSVYILADTFFIANFIGADGLAALNLALPVYGVINGTGLLIGVGGATRYTVCRTGRGGNPDAPFTASLFLGAAAAAVFLAVGLFFAGPLAGLLGADGSVLAPTTVYLRVCCLFSPFFILNNILVAFTRNDDAPGRAMAAMLVGSLANIVMDAYLVCIAGLGMLGAVLATGMAPLFGIALCLCRHRGYHPRRCRFRPELGQIFAAGFSSFVGELSSTVVILVFNYLLLALAGSTGVAAYGIIANVALVATAVLTGAAQGAQPLFSRAFAENDRAQLARLTRWSICTAFVLGALLALGAYLFPETVVAVFSRGDEALASFAVPGLTLFFTNYLFSGISLQLTARFAAAGRPRPAALLSLLRGMLLVVPCALLGAALFGVTGLWLAVPAAELLTLLCGIWLLRRKSP